MTNQPLILTSNQLAQLSNGGVLQLNAGNATTNATAANGSMVIKSEPNPLTLGATPTVQNVSSEDVSSTTVRLNKYKTINENCSVLLVEIIEKTTTNDQKSRICLSESQKEERICD